MAVKPNVNMLCSHISHMAFLFVWRDSGVTQKHGFDLNVQTRLDKWSDGIRDQSDSSFSGSDFLRGANGHDLHLSSTRERGD